MNELALLEVIEAHKVNYESIVRAIAQTSLGLRPKYLQLAEVKNYQRYIYSYFPDIIDMRPFEYISKVDKGWLIVNDHRSEISARISLIVERYGIGVGMLVLHAQQMNSGHILLEMPVEGNIKNIAKQTERLYGTRGENILYIPIRQFRRDTKMLAALNIVKPIELWNHNRIIRHTNDKDPFCFYCSANEINPAEVVINIDGIRLGLSRDYSLGFTFAPFGNPLSSVHFLAWDYAQNPLDMSRTPMTVSDLVKMTEQINVSIMNFFAGTNINDYPIIDGISNGWGGSSIYHQHFQFFQPEYDSPIVQDRLLIRTPVLSRDDIRINKLAWSTAIYKISAKDSINVGLIGNDIAGIWKLQNPTNNTQNIYVAGSSFGKTAYMILRDRSKVGFIPTDSDYVNEKQTRKAQKKTNMGALECTGTMIVDDYDIFKNIESWEPDDVSQQIRLMTLAICPEQNAVDELERSIENLFG